MNREHAQPELCGQTWVTLEQDWSDPFEGQAFALCLINQIAHVSDAHIDRLTSQMIEAGAIGLLYVGEDGETWLSAYDHKAAAAQLDTLSMWSDANIPQAIRTFCQDWCGRFDRQHILWLIEPSR